MDQESEIKQINKFINAKRVCKLKTYIYWKASISAKRVCRYRHNTMLSKYVFSIHMCCFVIWKLRKN